MTILTYLKQAEHLMRRSPMRKNRSKPRPGRLKGKALQKLREDCFDRDKGRCTDCGCLTLFYADPIYDVSYHMAHIKAKRIGGDSLENVRTLCGSCHRDSHQGTKNGKMQHRPAVPPEGEKP